MVRKKKKIDTARQLILLSPNDLIGKTFKWGDVVVKVKSVSLWSSGVTYIHPGEPNHFGWAITDRYGNMIEDWQLI